MRLDFPGQESVCRPWRRGRPCRTDQTLAALEALEAVLIVIIEDAHEIAVTSAPEAVDAHGERIAALRQVGADIVVIAEACAVLLRSAEMARNG